MTWDIFAVAHLKSRNFALLRDIKAVIVGIVHLNSTLQGHGSEVIAGVKILLREQALLMNMRGCGSRRVGLALSR